MIRALRLAGGLASFSLVVLFAMQTVGLVDVRPAAERAGLHVPAWLILVASVLLFLTWFLYLWSTVPYLDLDALREANSQLRREVHDRVQAEEALRASQARLQGLLDAVPDVIWRVSGEGIFLDCRAGKDWPSSLRWETVSGRRMSDVLPSDVAERCLESAAEALAREETRQVEFELDFDGEPHDCEARVVPIGPDETLFILRDVTQERRSQEQRAQFEAQLHQAQKMEAVGQLASGMAHDFNNLLTVILGSSEVLGRMLPPDPVARETLRMIEEATRQATQVSRSLLTFSGRMPTNKEPVDLAVVVGEAVRLVRRVLPATIDLVLAIEPARPLWAHADSSLLQQVVLNLAINARDAMPEGGTLRISLGPAPLPTDGQSPSGSARLIVSDTGVGMERQTLARIFEPFFTTKPRGQGTGLGLAMVHGVIEDHGSLVQVESEVGKGSTFTIDLPCVRPGGLVGAAAGRAAGTLARGEGQVILLAEDDAYVRAFMASTLFSLGYETIQAGDGAALAESFDRHREDVRLLVVDVDLPRRSGLDVVRELRGRGITVPAIIVTGSGVAQLSSLDPRSVLLRKPFAMSELASLANRLLAQGPGPPSIAEGQEA